MEMIKTVDLHKSFGELKVLKGVNEPLKRARLCPSSVPPAAEKAPSCAA